MEVAPAATPAPVTTTRGNSAFTTSTMVTGNMGGLAGADALCQARATAAGRGGVFKAWLSDSTQSASARLAHSTVPYVLTNGVRIANNWADLTDGELADQLNYDELGAMAKSNQPFTGTDYNGEAHPDYCADWTSTDGRGFVGQSDQRGKGWSSNNNYANNCSKEHRLICLQQ